VVEESALATFNPQPLLAAAIEGKATPETLAKLTDLMERWMKMLAEKQFNEAMNRAQINAPTVVRDLKNSETGKGYAPVETVQTYMKPVYTVEGFALSFGTEVGSAEYLTHVWMDTRHTGGHTARTWLHNVPNDNTGPKGGKTKSDIQGLMSSISYAQGRLIRMAFNVTVADEDRDGQMDTISKEQVEEIEKWFDDCEKIGKPVSQARMLHWLRVDSWDKLPLKKFPLCIDELTRKFNEKKQ
jgi:hypothetical protein